MKKFIQNVLVLKQEWPKKKPIFHSVSWWMVAVQRLVIAHYKCCHLFGAGSPKHVLHLGEVFQHARINNNIYHSMHVQKHNGFNMFDQSLSLETSVQQTHLWLVYYAMRRVFSLITISVCVCVCVRIHVHMCVCVFHSQTALCLPWRGASGWRKAVFILAYMLLALLGASHALIFEFMVVQKGCGFDLGQHHMSPPFKAEFSSLLFFLSPICFIYCTVISPLSFSPFWRIIITAFCSDAKKPWLPICCNTEMRCSSLYEQVFAHVYSDSTILFQV